MCLSLQLISKLGELKGAAPAALHLYSIMFFQKFDLIRNFWNLTEHQPALFEYMRILTTSGNSKRFPFWQVAYLPHWNSTPQPKQSATWYLLPPVPLEWRGDIQPVNQLETCRNRESLCWIKSWANTLASFSSVSTYKCVHYCSKLVKSLKPRTQGMKKWLKNSKANDNCCPRFTCYVRWKRGFWVSVSTVFVHGMKTLATWCEPIQSWLQPKIMASQVSFSHSNQVVARVLELPVQVLHTQWSFQHSPNNLLLRSLTRLTRLPVRLRWLSKEDRPAGAPEPTPKQHWLLLWIFEKKSEGRKTRQRFGLCFSGHFLGWASNDWINSDRSTVILCKKTSHVAIKAGLKSQPNLRLSQNRVPHSIQLFVICRFGRVIFRQTPKSDSWLHIAKCMYLSSYLAI